MRKKMALILALACMLALTGCGESRFQGKTTEFFRAEILEVREKSYLVAPADGSPELASADQIVVPIPDLDAAEAAKVGDVVQISYDGRIGESYPAQIFEVYSITVVKEEGEPMRAWNVSMEVENPNAKGLTLVFKSIGVKVDGQLLTGSWFLVERWDDNTGWTELPYLPMEGELGWTAEAYLIPQDGTTTKLAVNWEYLYAPLTKGDYRISKEVTAWRENGENEKKIVLAEFVIDQ